MIKGTALVLEDSETQAKLISKLIEREGWEAVACKTLDVAVNYLKTHPVHCLFVDVFLADESTLPKLPILRGLALKAPLAVMTAGSSQEAIEDTLMASRRAGADYVLRKPFDTKMIKKILDSSIVEQKHVEKRKHALVIEDCRVVRHLTVETLANTGLRVSEAKDMEDALHNIDIAHVDVVITDIFMPGMGGIEGIKLIKSTWPKVKIIAMSAGIDQKMTAGSAIKAAKFVGADAELNKPFQPQDLIRATESLMYA